MSFTKLRTEVDSKLDQKITSLDDYLKKYLSSTINSKLEKLEGQFLEYLYHELSKIEIEKVNTQNYLSSSYKRTEEFAKNCLKIVLNVNDLYGTNVKSWTEEALKCFDNFILVLIQEKLNEKITKDYGVGVERQKYQHLIHKENDYKQIGISFDIIYQQRNSFYHIEIVDEDGYRKQRPISNKQYLKSRDIIINEFSLALSALHQFVC